MTINTLTLLGKEYGKTAFGLVSVLVIWQFVVKPELHKRDLDWEKHTQMLGVLEDISDSQLDASRSIESASGSIESASQSLNETALVLKEVASQLTVTK
ncbi:MAG: hypothetical protein AAGJ40_02800 [Planctomycetota bacterium]